MKKKLLLIAGFAIMAFTSASAQVTTAWQSTYASPYHLVDYGREIKLDAAGNVYVSGHSFVDTQQHGNTLIIKYDNNGNQQWVYRDTSIWEMMEDMFVDPAGNSYFTGYKWINNAWDYLTIKVDPNGNELWKSTFNGQGNHWDEAFAMTVDGAGNVYVTGRSKASWNGYQFATVKYDSNGQQLWVSYFAEPYNPSLLSNYFNISNDIITDHAGNVYVSGYSFDDTTHWATLVKYDSNGNYMWSNSTNTYMKVSDIAPTYIGLDGNDNVYLCSNVNTAQGGSDIRVQKYDPSGVLAWSHIWDTPTHDSDYVGADYYCDQAMQVDYAGNVYVSGTSIYQNVAFTDNIVSFKLDPNGNLLWDDIYNGTGNDQDISYGIVLDGNGDAYVCGLMTHGHGLYDGDYITFKLNGATGNRDWIMTFNGSLNYFDEAKAITTDSAGNIYITGHEGKNDPVQAGYAVTNMVTIKYSPSSASVNEGSALEGLQFYPNPVMDEANIKLDLKETSFVTITVTDIAGRVLGVILKEQLNSGTHIVPVNAEKLDLAPGAYFFTVISGTATTTGKFTVSR